MRLVMTGGGTAGHIMPCVALIEELKGDFEIHYIGSESGMEKDIIGKLPFVIYHTVTTVKLVRKLSLKNLGIPFKLTKGVSQAKKLLKQIKPDVVFSKGGFVSLPAALACKCPLICHESDLTIGLANRLTKNKALHFCTSFESTVKGLKNGVFTGSPVRGSLYRAKKISTRPVLLIMGGSLGAKALNNCVSECIVKLTAKYDVIHLTGKGKATDIVSPHYTQMEFCSDMGQLFSKASVAVSRGGGSALFELAALKIPSLIIPLPKGVSRGDQVDNAAYFSSRGLCKVLSEDNLTPDNLLAGIDEVLRDNTLKTALSNAKNIDGTKKIAQLILQAARNKTQ